MQRNMILLSCFLFLIIFNNAYTEDIVTSPYLKWQNGPSHDAGFFPIAVWLQNPANASRYRQAGFNTYVGLWRGPTEKQLNELKRAGMKVICHQNQVGLKYVNEKTIIGWMHGDELTMHSHWEKAKDMGRRLNLKK